MFDVVYVTWGTHVLAALVTAKAWYLYFAVRLLHLPAPYVDGS